MRGIILQAALSFMSDVMAFLAPIFAIILIGALIFIAIEKRIKKNN